jgi:hypothetical protein
VKAPCSDPISSEHPKQETEVKYAVLILHEAHCHMVESICQRPSYMGRILERVYSPRTETHARELKMYGPVGVYFLILYYGCWVRG